MSPSSLAQSRLVANYISTCLRIEEMHEAKARGEDIDDILARTNALAEEMEMALADVLPGWPHIADAFAEGGSE